MPVVHSWMKRVAQFMKVSQNNIIKDSLRKIETKISKTKPNLALVSFDNDFLVSERKETKTDFLPKL